jgi:hypothetical protein
VISKVDLTKLDISRPACVSNDLLAKALGWRSAEVEELPS